MESSLAMMAFVRVVECHGFTRAAEDLGVTPSAVRWQLPDLDTSEIGYPFAREAYRKAGREVVDATIGGKLAIFPKVDYNSLF